MYQALYRKWRPKTFSQVVGQDHITGTLQRQVAEGRTAHAYLFTGTRGTGKTTCARILAKAVNCLHPEDGAPCNQCEACRGIDSGSLLDVTELDAASNSRVDDIRELLSESVYTPTVLKKRVYIIDEVHMLSTQAFYSTTFDALTMVVSSYSYKRLKPEQEPDKRVRTFWAVVFILLPIALIFSENSMHSLQSVSIIAAFPIGIIILMIAASFFKDASGYLQERKDT